ncbi:MAG: hypothetical protein RIC53_12365 [Cyclobacteriaceae bacterium]
MVLWLLLTSYDNCYPCFILNPKGSGRYWALLFAKLIPPSLALYAVSVRQAGNLLPTSFRTCLTAVRFHLTEDTLALN